MMVCKIHIWPAVRRYLLLHIFTINTVHGFLFPSNITCYCNNKNWSGHSQRKCIDNRCHSQSSVTQCYVMKTDENTVEKGCTFQPLCIGFQHRGKLLKKKIIHCCRYPLCNQYINGTDFHYYTSVTVPPKKESAKLSKEILVIIIAIPVSLILILITIFSMWRHFRKPDTNFSNSILRPSNERCYRADFLEYSSAGSGAGLPLLVEQTISLQIVLKECVNKGKFGVVYRGTWHDEDVAVKIFSTGEETSWFCEREIYQTNMLRHENILGFIAADSKDTGVCTEYWLVCEYHSKGSLFNYLQTEVLNIKTMLKMVFGIVCGLNHLHMQIVGSQGKPPIAHRDMKTKNILVKNNNTCCIADFGLAITRTTVNSRMMHSSRTGTRRYHSPELLNSTIDSNYFDSYLKADIYALGLCLWEVCWRTKVLGAVQEYQLPYYDLVPSNPSEEDMLQVVYIEHKRPIFCEYWSQVKEMKSLMKTMEECWCQEASARLPTLRIKKNVAALFQDANVSV